VEIYIFLVYILAYIGLFATTFYIINLLTYYKKKRIIPESTKETVTILIPAYNEEKGMKKTIESALALDYPKHKLEIIVIDDGSKDKTYEIAKKFESNSHPKIKVLTKKNGGKGTALNFGIKRSKGEIIITMDADTAVQPDALKKMVGYFSTSKKVMCVSPSMGIYKPKNFWQRIQQIEYHMGVFLRKSFASVNAIHVTPGAFSAYKKTFFDKYGDFDEGNLTEDLELALRIQVKGYAIENSPESVAYTISPNTFRTMLAQRKRWYAGLIKNLWRYRQLFGIKKGALGAVILPTAVTTVVLSVILTIYLIIRTTIKIKDELISFHAVNFQFKDVIEINKYVFQNFFYSLFSNKVFIITILFLTLLWFYLVFSKRKMNYDEGMRFNFLLFVIFYGFLFAFWWIVSFFYVFFNKEVTWRDEDK
jgi:poly-beta-1,6-N-acetyl-D-glucosamine synthase